MIEASAHIERPCPGCGEVSVRPTRYFSSPRAEDVAAEAIRENWRGFFKEKVFFSYVRCAQCGLLYCPRFLAPDALGELYSRMEDNTAGTPLRAVSKTQAGYYGLVKNDWRAGDYLEVGPDIGLVARLASRDRPQARLFLFEPNHAVWPQLKAACTDPARAVLSHAMDDLSEVPDRTVGLAVMVHVLDHMMTPIDYLKALRSKLAQGGRVLIVVHNERSLLARLFGARYPIFCMQHPQLFAPETLVGMLDKAGLRALRVVRTKNYFPAETLARHLLFQLGIDPKWAPRSETPVGLRLGNIAAVATV